MDNTELKLEMREDPTSVYLDISSKGDYKGFIMYDPERDKTFVSPKLKEFLKNGINT